jgi:transcriptional regulator with XRE-family HTH domain
MTEPKTSTEFRKWLIASREAQGHSVNSLALEAGVDQSTLNKVERGTRSPTDDMLKAVAQVLGIGWPKMKAMADIGRLGEGALDRIKSEAPEALGLVPIPRPPLNPIIMLGLTYPESEEETAVFDEAWRLGIWPLPALTQPGYWVKTPEERRDLFEDIRRDVQEQRAILESQKGRGPKSGGKR